MIKSVNFPLSYKQAKSFPPTNQIPSDPSLPHLKLIFPASSSLLIKDVFAFFTSSEPPPPEDDRNSLRHMADN